MKERDLYFDNLKGALKTGHQILIEILVLVACCVLLRYGFTMIAVSSASRTPTLKIPTCVIYAALPVGCVGMIVGTIRNIVSRIPENKEG